MAGKKRTNSENGKSSVVKIDSSLLDKVENFIKKEKNRLRFVNKKQFIDIIVFEFLKKQKEGSG